MNTHSLKIVPKVAGFALVALIAGALPAHAQDMKGNALSKALARFKDAQAALQGVRAGQDAAPMEREFMLSVLDVIAQRNEQLKDQLQSDDDAITVASVSAVAARTGELAKQVGAAQEPQELKKLATDIYMFQTIQVQAVRKMMLLSYVDRIEKLIVEPGMKRAQSLTGADAAASLAAMRDAQEALQSVRTKIVQAQLDEASLSSIEALVGKAQKSVGEAYRIFREAAMRMSEATSSPAAGR
jgi:hypothetical protein